MLQAMFILIIPSVLKQVSEISDFFIKLFLIILIFTALTIDIIYYYQQVHKRKALIYIKPRKCIIEDFIVTYYAAGKNRSYNRSYYIEPVIKDIETGQLYFTYSNYNLSYYNSIEVKNGKKIVQEQIFGKDDSIVQIGDKAVFYVKRILAVSVSIDYNKNKIYINNKEKETKMHCFIHFNNNYSCEDIKRFIFFKGTIDIEKI